MKMGYVYDVLNNTLTCSTAFLKKASVLNTPEYLILKQLRADNPDMTITVAEKKSRRKSTPDITFEKMKGFISQCADSVERLKVFNSVCTLAKVQSSPYAYVKKWFLENYANYTEQPQLDKNGFVIPKTRKEMEAEKKAREEARPQTQEQAEAEQSSADQNKVLPFSA